MPVSGQKQHWFYSRWFLIIGSVVFVMLLAGLGRAWYAQRKVHQLINQLQAEHDRLEAKRLETLQALHYARSAAFIEERARLELNLVKPGEQAAIVVGGTESKAINSARQDDSAMVKSSKFSNFLKWWEYFFSP